MILPHGDHRIDALFHEIVMVVEFGGTMEGQGGGCLHRRRPSSVKNRREEVGRLIRPPRTISGCVLCHSSILFVVVGCGC